MRQADHWPDDRATQEQLYGEGLGVTITAEGSVMDMREALNALDRLVAGAILQGYPRKTAEYLRNAIEPALASQQTAEPVAKVVSKYGDPESFGERELEMLIDLSELPYGTKLYTPAPTAQDSKVPEDLVDRAIYLIRGYQEALDEGDNGYANQWKAHLRRLLSAAPVPETAKNTLPAGKRVVSLASYCGDDSKGCTDNGPCMDCLRMCNTFELKDSVAAVYTKQLGDVMPAVPDKPQQVSCEERLPTAEDGDFLDQILAYNHENKRWEQWSVESFHIMRRAFTHWVPTGLQRPEAPEGE